MRVWMDYLGDWSRFLYGSDYPLVNIGEYITIYRDSNNVLRAELTSGSTVTDVITWIDDESSLFELESGDNLISATDEEGGASLVATFTFNPARAVLYES